MPRNVGIVFDIDGVLIREKSVLPGASKALQLVEAAKVPHIFVTNGGEAPFGADSVVCSAFQPLFLRGLHGN